MEIKLRDKILIEAFVDQVHETKEGIRLRIEIPRKGNSWPDTCHVDLTAVKEVCPC